MISEDKIICVHGYHGETHYAVDIFMTIVMQRVNTIKYLHTYE